MADKRLHPTTKGQVEVDGDACGRHSARTLLVEKCHFYRKSKHVGQRQAEIPLRLRYGDKQADITLIKVEYEAIFMEEAKGTFQSLAVLGAQLSREETR